MKIRAVNEKVPPLIGPKKIINKEIKYVVSFFAKFPGKLRVLKLTFLAFLGVPGGFREVREAGMNHFHLFWYLIVPGITSYGR